MSWNFNAAGKPKAVSRKIETDLSRITCQEPEQGIKTMVIKIVQAALEPCPENSAFQIEASGSQWTDSTLGTTINQLSLKIMPIYGFVE